MPFTPIPEILDEVRAGRMVILVDDENRENEGDLLIAAEKVTPDAVNFMIKHGRGLVCLAITPERAEALGLRPQTSDNTTRFGTAFLEQIDARLGTTTGISPAERAHTIKTTIREGSGPSDLVKPGHEPREEPVLVRVHSQCLTGDVFGSRRYCATSACARCGSLQTTRGRSSASPATASRSSSGSP